KNREKQSKGLDNQVADFIYLGVPAVGRRCPATSPQPVVVWSQCCKKSFLRSLFCSSVHIASRPCGLSA
ncbi:MAG TPA: hypothetical protein PK980_08210, partial [Paludibacteraceae bacterium]|nr:hypothetical protein [Paludibacteraceae bacterium]